MRRSWLTGFALVCAVGLVGCSGSGGPAVSGSPVVSVVPTPTPTGPVAPVRPAEIDRMDEVGAAAAAKYFIELYGYVLHTGDLTQWDAMSYKTCEFCTSIHDHVAGARSRGESVDGGSTTAELVAVHELDSIVGGYPVDLKVVQDATTLRDSTGQVVGSVAASSDLMRFETTYVESAWRIGRVSVDGATS